MKKARSLYVFLKLQLHEFHPSITRHETVSSFFALKRLHLLFNNIICCFSFVLLQIYSKLQLQAKEKSHFPTK